MGVTTGSARPAAAGSQGNGSVTAPGSAAAAPPGPRPGDERRHRSGSRGHSSDAARGSGSRKASTSRSQGPFKEAGKRPNRKPRPRKRRRPKAYPAPWSRALWRPGDDEGNFPAVLRDGMQSTSGELTTARRFRGRDASCSRDERTTRSDRDGTIREGPAAPGAARRRRLSQWPD